MKNQLKKIALISAIGLLASSAFADIGRSQLDQISHSEASWTGTSATAGGFQGQIGVYVTDQNKVRLASLPTSFQASAELDKPSLRRINGKILGDWCANTRLGFAYAKSQRAAYSLTVHINPLAAGSSIAVGGSRVAGGDIENAAKIMDIIPRLELSANAVSVVDTGINKTDFERAVRTQLASQRDSVANTGDAVLDLTGWDDVACDLAQGNAILRFGMNMMFDSALVTRQVVITGDQLQRVYSGVRPSWRDQSGVVKNVILGGALLGASMMSQLQRSPIDFGVDNFIGVFSQLFELQGGKLKSLSNSDMPALSENLDLLSRGATVATPQVQSSITVLSR